MQIFKEIGPLKAFLVEKRKQGNTIGFVATMGALHEGHLKLVRDSRNDNSTTICSIFVNPSQFNNPADLQKYPRTLEKDILMLTETGCDALFCPEVDTMYNQESRLRFDFGQLDKVMEGQFRPGHFSGVALVVSKLFHIVEPDIAYFGQKDWQQFAIIRQLVSELKFNVTLKSVQTLREANGLAMSSRNARLSSADREKAGLISQMLQWAVDKLKGGAAIHDVKKMVTEKLQTEAGFTVEYFEVADSENLTLLNNVTESARPILCIAVFVGDVRLIDNMFL
ncbi:MAG TPA: pantoate--beta-alanine ligase [Cyclobacteriaceae bacterium]|nr:pantoate--beta-alanine ligase [Cyclobacteriaceae bacterium]HMV07416.1 pantoate--beta-alanine ligase [Cyclobacteriaceae bacterium]HMV88980.1 pantoate--beta-alanine ligase [Cyclobacteriaceae bacterium]HMW99229.1 pantoate--beta-alanine ligase [Cyclobacteriaceae bacterium]HMX48982.1 pantoate--beta-alanine ligase [Cyclobacteriaceae bacterium]